MKKKKKKPKKPVAPEGEQVKVEPSSVALIEDENFYDLDDEFIDDSGIHDELITENFLMQDSNVYDSS